MGWFVQPDMVTLTLENGNYLQVKKRLTSKEARKVFSGIVKTMIPGEKIELDPEQVGVTKVLAYVVGWGGPDCVGEDGRAVPFSAAALDNVSPDAYAQIVKAIDAHEAAQDAEIEAEKNGQAGSTNSGATSASAA